MFEYLNHVLTFAPGPEGETHARLNSFARDGWRVVSSFFVPTPPSLTTGRPGMALWVLLERPKAES